MNKTDKFKSLLHKLIKEELETGDDENKQSGLEKLNYDLVLEPADLQSALSALGDIKNYGIYANNLRDPKIIQKIFGPSNPPQKANTAWRTWDTFNEEEKFAKAADIRNRVPEAWEKLEIDLADKYDEWQAENGEGSFIEFIITLKSTDLRNIKSNAFFGSRGANFYPIKNPDSLKKYSGVMTKDKDYIVSGDKIIFPQKSNPFETKDYLTKVLKTIMGNAKLSYSISQKEANNQPTSTSNMQGAIEKINFVKTFDSPELAKKFMKFIPKDFSPKTELDGTKITVSDITDAQKKNLMADASKFIDDNKPKKKLKEGIKDFFKDPMNVADARGWMKNSKLSDSEKREKIKSVMKDPSKFNDLMDEFTDELKIFKKPVKESIKNQINTLIKEILAEKKFPDLTGDGKVTRADILKGRGVELKNEGKNKTVQEYYDEILDKIKLAARSLNDDDAYELHEKLKIFFDKLI